MLFTMGCAGRTLTEIPEDVPLPSEAKELSDQFEVREIAPVEPKPTPSPTLEPSPRKKKRAIAPPKPVEPVGVTKIREFQRATSVPLVGEKLTYGISYLGIHAGEFVVETLSPKIVNERSVHHVKASVKSAAVFSVVYSVDDVLESFIDEIGFFPLRFQMKVDQSSQKRQLLELYEVMKSRVFYWNRQSHKTKGDSEVKEYLPVQPYSQDVLSFLYFLRVIPLEMGKVYEFPVAQEGKQKLAKITVLGRETLRTPLGYKTPVLKIQPDVYNMEGHREGSGDSFIWMTDDDLRYVVLVEAKARFGTITARLDDFRPGKLTESASAR